MNLLHSARLAVACALAVAAVSAVAQTAATSAAAPAAPAASAIVVLDPLFDALGGKPGIALLMDDFVPRLAADPKIGAFFKDTNLRELKKQLTDQFCAVSGGGCVYEGDDMKRAHANMKVAKADFNRLVEILQVSMDARAIPFADQNRLLARLAPMHRDIVNVH
jgi:hemoglobin